MISIISRLSLRSGPCAFRDLGRVLSRFELLPDVSLSGSRARNCWICSNDASLLTTARNNWDFSSFRKICRILVIVSSRDFSLRPSRIPRRLSVSVSTRQMVWLSQHFWQGTPPIHYFATLAASHYYFPIEREKNLGTNSDFLFSTCRACSWSFWLLD